MKKLSLLLLLLTSFMIFSCSSDDDSNNENENDLLGSWNLVAFNGNTDVECPITLTFTATQVTENEFFGSNCGELDSITDPYVRDGDTVTVSTDIGDFVFEITTLTQTALVFETNDPDTNELTVLTYERIE